jgi:hypothetical protein
LSTFRSNSPEVPEFPGAVQDFDFSPKPFDRALLGREVYRFTTFRISTVIGGLGSAFSPGVRHLRQVIL